MKKEFRSFEVAEFRAKETDGKIIFSGYAAKYNKRSCNLGGFYEILRKGAFDETIKKDDIRALFNHDPSMVLGRNKAGTLTLKTDDTGLYFEAEAPNTTWAQDLQRSVERGDIDQCSFGFWADEDNWEEKEDCWIREVLKATLFDVSIVTYPAYEDTSAGTRSAKDVFEDHKKEMQSKRGLTETRRKRLELKSKTL